MKSALFGQSRGFCSLGAQQSVEAIHGAISISYTGRTCAYRLYQGMSEMNGHQGMGNYGGSSLICTGMQTLGPPRKKCTDLLPNVLETLKKTHRADLFVVLTGCLAEIIGEDTDAVVRHYRKAGYPVIHVNLPGFAGNAWLGHEKFMKGLVDQWVEETFEQILGLVNLWADVPYLDPFWSGNLLELKRLLEGIGLKVNVLFGLGSSVDAWKRIPSAALNLVISPWVGVSLATLLRERFGTPFLHWSRVPVGYTETARFLTAVRHCFSIPEKKFNDFLKLEKKAYFWHLNKGLELFIRDDPRFPRAVHCIADCHTALSMAFFFKDEMGIPPGKLFLIDKAPAKYLDQIWSLGDAFEIIWVDNALEIEPRLLQESQNGEPAILLGSFWDEPLAKKLGYAFLPISAPLGERLVLNQAWCGTSGALRLLEEFWNAVLSL